MRNHILCGIATCFVAATCHAVEFTPTGPAARNAQAHTDTTVEYDGAVVGSDPDQASGQSAAIADSEVDIAGFAYARAWSQASNHSILTPAQPGQPKAWRLSCLGHYLGDANIAADKWHAEAWAWHQTAIRQTFRAEDDGVMVGVLKFSQTVSGDPDLVARYWMTAAIGRSEVTWHYDFILDTWTASGTIWDVDAQGVEFSTDYSGTQQGFTFEPRTVYIAENVTDGDTIGVASSINGDDPWGLSWLIAYLFAEAFWASGEDAEHGYMRHDVEAILDTVP